MSEHTPGPWRATDMEQTRWRIVGPTPRKDDYAQWWLVAETISHEPEDEANARLIAAAPDLLAACKVVLELFNTMEDGSNSRRFAVERAVLNQVIAKADGR